MAEIALHALPVCDRVVDEGFALHLRSTRTMGLVFRWHCEGGLQSRPVNLKLWDGAFWRTKYSSLPRAKCDALSFALAASV
jgi:hypothetical protein